MIFQFYCKITIRQTKVNTRSYIKLSSHDVITRKFVGKSLIMKSVMKRLRKQDKFLAGFETRIKRKGKGFYVYSALRNKRKLDVQELAL